MGSGDVVGSGDDVRGRRGDEEGIGGRVEEHHDLKAGAGIGSHAAGLLENDSFAAHGERDALTVANEDNAGGDGELDVDTTTILDEDGRVVKDSS